MIPRMTLPEEVRRLLEDYFRSYSERRYSDHLACYAPDALVVAGTQIAPRDVLTPSEYQEALEEGELKPYRLLTIDPEGYAPTPEDVVAAIRVADDSHLEIDLLAWCVRESDGWAVMGLAAQEADSLRSWPELQARIWGELAQRDLKPSYHPIDLIVWRLWPQESPKLIALPESRFTCQDRGECCHVGRWGVEISREAHSALARVEWSEVIDRLEGQELFRELPLRPGQEVAQMSFGVNATDSCVFHLPVEDGSRKICGVHATLGRPVVMVCETYPFTFTETPDGVCAYTSFVCRTSASNQGQPFEDRTENILTRFRRLQGAVPRVEDRVPWSEWTDALPWTAYREIEKHLLDFLGRTDLPHFNRLVEAYRFMVILASSREVLQDDETWIADAWGQLADAAPLPVEEGIDPQDEMVQLLTMLMLSSKGHIAKTYSYEKFQGDYPALIAAPPRLEPDEEGADLLTRFIRRLIFQKRHLGKQGAVMNFQLVLLSYRAVILYARYLKFLEGADVVQTEDLYMAVRAHDQVMLHTHAVADEGFIEHPQNAARLRDLATGAALLGLE